MMKKISFALSIVVLFAFLAHLDSCAQQRRNLRGQGRGMGQQLSRNYDPQSVVSVKGTVNKIEQYQYGQGRYYGIHVLLDTQEEVLSVHLGPAWFIENEMKIELNDVLEIKGSKIVYNDTLTVIAAQIKKGDQRLLLRNEIGIPVWSQSGYGRRRQ